MGYGQHFQQVAAILKQTGGYRAIEVPPTASDCVRVDSINFKPEFNEHAQGGHIGRMAPRGSTEEMHGCTFELIKKLEPNGTTATQSDHAKLLEVGYFGAASTNNTATTIAVGGWAAKDTGDLTSAAHLSVGDIVPFEKAVGEGIFECAQITDISGATVTIAPALSFTPAAGAAVGKGITHSPDNTISSSALSLFANAGSHCETGWGCVPDYKFSFGGLKPAMLTASGFCRGYAHGTTTTLATELLNDATDTTVDLTHAERFEENQLILVESEVILLGEKSPVDDKFYNSTRNVTGGLAAHAASTAVSSYFPTPSTNGAEVGSPLCKFRVEFGSSTGAFVEGTTGEIEIGGGMVPDENEYGDRWKVYDYGKADDIEPKFSQNGKLKIDTYTQAHWAYRGTEFPMIWQFGDQIGKMCGIIYPRGKFNTFEKTQGDGRGSVAVKMSGVGRNAASGLDAFYYFEC